MTKQAKQPKLTETQLIRAARALPIEERQRVAFKITVEFEDDLVAQILREAEAANVIEPAYDRNLH
jgi:hypothetical protein